MSFLLNRDKRIVDYPLKSVFEELQRLYEAQDDETMWQVRLKLVEEYVEDAECEEDVRKIRGVQWRLDAQLQTITDPEDRCSHIKAYFWNGAEILKDRLWGHA